LSEYNSIDVNLHTNYLFDGIPVQTVGQRFSTVGYVDMDRSGWYAAPETRKADGTELNNVSEAPVADKNKSPYLSHLLPHSNAALDHTNGDGVNNQRAHFDGDSRTYLSVVKGLGTDASEGTSHTNGGVSISTVGEKPWFIIRLHPSEPQSFNYFRFRYRENGTNTQNVKPQGVTFFGSNDDDCITDESKWTQINTEEIAPVSANRDSNQPVPANMGQFYTVPGDYMESGNMTFPGDEVYEYRYIKVRYDRWIIPHNTLQLAEFWLGLYY
jgi:hypothetical protein